MDKSVISERLVKLRGTKSQEKVARATGISPSALSMYENGERVPRDEIKIRLAEYYGTSVEEIFFARR